MLRPLAVILSCALFLISCGALSPVAEKPQVTVRTVSLSSASFTGIDGRIDMDVFNPNPFGMPLHRVDWALSVGSSEPVRGSFDMSETIPAKASAPVTGSIRITAASAIGITAALASGERTYNLQAELYFQTKFGELKVAVTHQAKIVR